MLVVVVKFAVFVFMLAVTTFTFEVLGELSWLEDTSTTTAMGEISMYQMTYWMMTTVSTVGCVHGC